MPVLDQLSLSNAAPRRDMSPTGRFRRKIIEAIELQIAMAEAQTAGTSSSARAIAGSRTTPA